MIQHLCTIFITISILFSSLFSPATKVYHAESFNIDVFVQENGGLLVTETLTLNFVEGAFTYVFRDLPTALTDGINDIHAKMDGHILPTGENAEQVEIEGSDPIHIVWHFTPTKNSTHTFSLSYRVAGVIRRRVESFARL